MTLDKHTVMREAQKFVARGQYDRAIAEWKKLLRESPHDANLYNTIGDLCLKKDAKTDAADAYRRAADILASEGFTSKAIALYKKTLNINPRNMEVHLALGDLNAEKGLTSNALESYKIVADYYTQQNDMGKALSIYQKMADLNSANITFRIKLADMYAKQGMVAEASKAYLDASDVYLSKDAFNDARHLFERVLSLDPRNKEVYYRAGTVYIKEGKFDEACKALKPAFENDPENRKLVDTYVEALIGAEKDSDAELVLKNIIDADPSRIDAIQKICTIYLHRKDYDRALGMTWALSNAFVAQDDQNAAEDSLKKFIAECPNYTPGRLKLADFYIYVRRDDDAARIFLETAEILSDEGDLEGAKAALSRARDIDSEMPEVNELFKRLSTPIIAIPPTPDPEESRIPLPMEEPVHLEPVSPEQALPVQEISIQELPAAEDPSIEVPIMTSPVTDAQTMEAPSEEKSAEPEIIDPEINEAFSEIDVLVKYGLATKALEQLENISRKYPENIDIRIKLSNLYGDLGQMAKSAEHMIVLANLYTARGMQDKADETLRTASIIDPVNMKVQSGLHGESLGDMFEAPPDTGDPNKPFAAEPELPTSPLDDVNKTEYQPAEVAQEVESSPPPVEPNIPFAAEPELPTSPLDDVNKAEYQPAEVAQEVESSPPPVEPNIPFAAEPELPTSPLDDVNKAEYQPAEVAQEVESSPPPSEELLKHEPAPTDVSAFEGLAVDALPVAEFDSIAAMMPLSEPESQLVVEETSLNNQSFVERVESSVQSEPHEAIEEEEASADDGGNISEIEQAAHGLADEEETAASVIETTSEEESSERAEETTIHEPINDIDINEIWAEAEFYYQQGLFNEAKKHYAKIIELYPDEKQAIARLTDISREEEETKELTRLADAVEKLEGVLSADPTDEELPLSASDEEAVRSLMSEIASLKMPKQQIPSASAKKAETPLPPAPPRAKEVSKPTIPDQAQGAEMFIDLGEELNKENHSSAEKQEQKSEDFFDLASELRDELSSEANTARPAAVEQSLDEIFQEFKRGVERSTNENVDTHYNLGVAYREMGLLDDAIGEFSIPQDGEPKFADSRYMLGLCYMEKGEFEKAIIEIEYALAYQKRMGKDENALIEMRYDLGLAFQGAGNIDSAQKEFQKVSSINPLFRDIASKLAEIKKGDPISHETLKDNIEKEISSKFLEENERIEREEKSRKNERVRN
jgi:pilus assembly protein FimV